MTANTKTLEAIVMCRSRATHDGDALFDAIADALEESLQPPAEKRGEAVVRCDCCGCYPAGGKDGSPCPFRECLGVLRDDPPPSREGEALPGLTGQFLGDGSVKMPTVAIKLTERRIEAIRGDTLHVNGVPTLNLGEFLALLDGYERAEVAEARASLAEQREKEARATAEQWRNEANDNADAVERNRQERETFRRERDEARARVAELEVAIDRLTSIIDEAFGLQPVQSPEDLLTLLESNLFERRRELEAARARVGELTDECAAMYDALEDLAGAVGANDSAVPQDVLDAWGPADHLLASINQKRGKPTPSAPTPPGYCECGTTENAAESIGGVRFCGKCGRGYVSAPTPAVVEKCHHDWESFLDVRANPKWDWRCRACGEERVGYKTAAMDAEHCNGAKETTGADGSAGTAKGNEAAATPSGEAIREPAQPPVPGGPSTPGLTPEEAEEGASRIYDMVARWLSGNRSAFDDRGPSLQRDFANAFIFAHSEGAKAAKAEGGETAGELRGLATDLLRSTRPENIDRIVTQLEALAAELEGAK